MAGGKLLDSVLLLPFTVVSPGFSVVHRGDGRRIAGAWRGLCHFYSEIGHTTFPPVVNSSPLSPLFLVRINIFLKNEVLMRNVSTL